MTKTTGWVGSMAVILALGVAACVPTNLGSTVPVAFSARSTTQVSLALSANEKVMVVVESYAVDGAYTLSIR
jgi:hypothetical protein